MRYKRLLPRVPRHYRAQEAFFSALDLASEKADAGEVRADTSSAASWLREVCDGGLARARLVTGTILAAGWAAPEQWGCLRTGAG